MHLCVCLCYLSSYITPKTGPLQVARALSKTDIQAGITSARGACPESGPSRVAAERARVDQQEGYLPYIAGVLSDNESCCYVRNPSDLSVLFGAEKRPPCPAGDQAEPIWGYLGKILGCYLHTGMIGVVILEEWLVRPLRLAPRYSPPNSARSQRIGYHESQSRTSHY